MLKVVSLALLVALTLAGHPPPPPKDAPQDRPPNGPQRIVQVTDLLASIDKTEEIAREHVSNQILLDSMVKVLDKIRNKLKEKNPHPMMLEHCLKGMEKLQTIIQDGKLTEEIVNNISNLVDMDPNASEKAKEMKQKFGRPPLERRPEESAGMNSKSRPGWNNKDNSN